MLLNLTSSNPDLSAGIFTDTLRFSDFVNGVISKSGARYAIGGYNEYRDIYSRSHVFDAVSGEEPRRRHLGLDIWSVAGTKVLAPINAVVHSTGQNMNDGDYGATMILQHELSGNFFYTLYGHIQLKDLAREPGTKIKCGEHFCSFGFPEENGNWPPHLHFQVIKDIGNYRGDYPGVCSEADKKFYLGNCPDPDLIADMNRFLK